MSIRLDREVPRPLQAVLALPETDKRSRDRVPEEAEQGGLAREHRSSVAQSPVPDPHSSAAEQTETLS
jgi:hypothetical protein